MSSGAPYARLIGSSLLVVLAAAAGVFSAMTLVAGLVTGPLSVATDGTGASAAAFVVGALGMGFAALSGYAASATWHERAVGQMLGLALAITALLASTATLLTGEFTESAALLYLAMALALVTAVALAAPGLHAPAS